MPLKPVKLTKILPCPFCGATEQAVEGFPWAISPQRTVALFHIQCPDCGASTVSCQSRADAIKRWNRRIEKEPAARER
jgi:restriction alleviation protein, Lar family